MLLGWVLFLVLFSFCFFFWGGGGQEVLWVALD